VARLLREGGRKEGLRPIETSTAIACCMSNALAYGMKSGVDPAVAGTPCASPLVAAASRDYQILQTVCNASPPLRAHAQEHMRYSTSLYDRLGADPCCTLAGTCVAHRVGVSLSQDHPAAAHAQTPLGEPRASSLWARARSNWNQMWIL
jgi:hypothetical protein